MAKEVVVKRTPKDVSVQARIDDRALTFGPDGTARITLDAGMHMLVYFLVAVPGTEFTIAIIAPPGAAWSRSHRVPSDGITIGTKKFKVNP